MTRARKLILLATYNGPKILERFQGLIRYTAADTHILVTEGNSPEGTEPVIPAHG